MTHLGDVAKAGNTGKATFVPSDQAALAAAISDIVGPDPRCEIPLLSSVSAARSCSGSVHIDGKAIACNTADGYAIHDSKLRLSGSACDKYKSSPSKLRVALPCDAVKTKK